MANEFIAKNGIKSKGNIDVNNNDVTNINKVTTKNLTVGNTGSDLTYPTSRGNVNQVLSQDTNGNIVWKDAGVGTVTSVALNSTTNDITITNGTVTTNGTINITFNPDNVNLTEFAGNLPNNRVTGLGSLALKSSVDLASETTGKLAITNLDKASATSGQIVSYDGTNIVWTTPGAVSLQSLTNGNGITTLSYNGNSATTVSVDFGTGTNQAARGDHNHGLWSLTDVNMTQAPQSVDSDKVLIVDNANGNKWKLSTYAIKGLAFESNIAFTDTGRLTGTLPVNRISSGTNGQFLQVDGSGNVVWGSAPSASLQNLTNGSGITTLSYNGSVAKTISVDFGTGNTQAARGDHTHSNTFNSLTDTTDYVVGDANKVLRINSAGNGVEPGIILGSLANKSSVDYSSSDIINKPTLKNNLSELSDVNITSPSNGSVLKYNSSNSKWEVGTDNTGSGGSGITFTDLQNATNVNIGGVNYNKNTVNIAVSSSSTINLTSGDKMMIIDYYIIEGSNMLGGIITYINTGTNTSYNNSITKYGTLTTTVSSNSSGIVFTTNASNSATLVYSVKSF